MERANLTGSDLQGVRFQEVNLRRADLTGADFRGATFDDADLRFASLRGAELQGATLKRVDLRGAELRDARLAGVDLSGCDIRHVRVCDAWLEKTRMHRDQLGGVIGEELSEEYDLAALGYLALERNFAGLGDPDSAVWAYLRRRRMQKNWARRRAGAERAAGRWGAATGWYARFAGDQFTEWLCDYGESVPRVLASLAVVFLGFSLIYGLTGGVVRLIDSHGTLVRSVTRHPFDLATFSLMAMSTSGSPVIGLMPRNEFIQFLIALEAFLGISLTGLLGFVLGNRIRR